MIKLIIKIIGILFISTLIGYTTNVVAVKMLFWPRRPINLGFYTMQGILPKRQAQIATSLGELVDKELLSMDDVLERVNTPEVQEKLVAKISELMRDRLSELLPRIIPARLIQVIIETLDRVLLQESGKLIDQLFRSGQEFLTEEIHISKIVEDKVNAFDLKQLEDMIKGVSAPELTFIEVLGGVMGFMIGLVQIAILLFLPGS
ncbi:Protein of unknown function DUF445, transmembrane [Syntrophomonas zehnderi OL-4]|uniref:DUF445 domain-containing protein n=1 Tax=Syntrophomonas zehnderi OL-4 TaxID=690567 RepID=A0A0E4GB24_9FIRM|nr:DUF445 family protein [Syntrophomonas zehnderi]CFX53485.1 Protein of unknown function DUF445, transmembrane [Syntrophomonas zehnderi OL-4]